VMLILILAAVLFLAGGMMGVLVTLAMGIHAHARADDQAGMPPLYIAGTRRVLGVGATERAHRGER